LPPPPEFALAAVVVVASIPCHPLYDTRSVALEALVGAGAGGGGGDTLFSGWGLEGGAAPVAAAAPTAQAQQSLSAAPPLGSVGACAAVAGREPTPQLRPAPPPGSPALPAAAPPSLGSPSRALSSAAPPSLGSPSLGSPAGAAARATPRRGASPAAAASLDLRSAAPALALSRAQAPTVGAALHAHASRHYSAGGAGGAGGGGGLPPPLQTRTLRAAAGAPEPGGAWCAPGEAAPPPPPAPRLPALIRLGRAQAGARFFLLARPFRVRAGRSGNEFLDTWVSRAYFASADAFPCTRRLSPVVGAWALSLNPLEAAAAALGEKNEALRDAMDRAEAAPDRAAEQGFTSLLQGVIDAAVAGGLQNYAPFLTGDFARSHPEIAEDLRRSAAAGGQPEGAPHPALLLLRAHLRRQLAILARGIDLHARKCAPEMLPLHAFLVQRFAALTERLADLGIVVEGGA